MKQGSILSNWICRRSVYGKLSFRMVPIVPYQAKNLACMCIPFHYISPSYLQGLLQHLRTNELEKNFHNLFLFLSSLNSWFFRNYRTLSVHMYFRYCRLPRLLIWIYQFIHCWKIIASKVPNTTTDEFSGCGSSYFQHPKRIKLPHIYNFPSKFLVFVTQQQHKHTKKQEDPTLDLPIQTSLNMCK